MTRHAGSEFSASRSDLGSTVDASGGQRIVFADILRGPAALVVVIAHLVLLNQVDPVTVAKLTMAAPPVNLGGPLPFVPGAIFRGIGPFGVGVFFLVSGFVIPLSLDHYARAPFLVARFWRIYPTYLVAFLLGLAALAASSHYWNQPFAYSAWDVALNAALVGDLLWRFDILTLVWTLEIEIKFYLLAALLLPWIRKPSPALLIGVSCLFIAIQIAMSLRCGTDTLSCWLRSSPFAGFAWEGTMISFMFIGTVFFGLHRGLVRPLAATITITILVGLFFLGWRFSLFLTLLPETPLAYVAALAVFTAAFMAREKVRHTAVTRSLSAISYPLYVIHPLVGYVTIRILVDQGVPLGAATGIALVLVFALATLLHVGVERPTMALGKRLARRMKARA